MATFPTQPRPSSRSSTPGTTMKGSASAPLLLPSIHKKPSTAGSMSTSMELSTISSKAMSKEIYGRDWTTEQRRLLHEARERHWLRTKAKNQYINFSDHERGQLRRYFDALAVPPSGKAEKGQDALGKRITIDKLEDMMISLGLAENRQEVNTIVEAIDDNGNGELDFEEWLTIVRLRADSNLYETFMAMMEGKLGDSNLNFKTVISNYRRKCIMDATGVTSPLDEQDPVKKVERAQAMERGSRILKNFAALQKSRYTELGGRSEIRSDENAILPFDNSGYVPPGGLEMLWRGVCADHNLVSSRPASAGGGSKRTIEPPLSPRTIVERIIPKDLKKPMSRFRGKRDTIMIPAADNSALRKQSPPPTR
mmetsp:Transcript_11455/g.20588  ORF Transcript_11455/g.20588 Transcript_11455/m.20588 type:complete len:367 (+) Transcript_11455:28-1128(+)